MQNQLWWQFSAYECPLVIWKKKSFCSEIVKFSDQFRTKHERFFHSKIVKFSDLCRTKHERTSRTSKKFWHRIGCGVASPQPYYREGWLHYAMYYWQTCHIVHHSREAECACSGGEPANWVAPLALRKCSVNSQCRWQDLGRLVDEALGAFRKWCMSKLQGSCACASASTPAPTRSSNTLQGWGVKSWECSIWRHKW
jgi:hypothetical protein